MIICTTPEIAEGLYEHLLILQISSFEIFVLPHLEIEESTKVYFEINNIRKELQDKISNLIGLYNQLIPDQLTLIAPKDDLQSFKTYWYPVKGTSFGFTHSADIIFKKKIGFGIGLHPSTILALRAMDSIIKNNKFETVVDVGAGSGILSIYALKKGIKNIVAYEIDTEAINAMKENFYLNNFDMGQVDLNPGYIILENLNIDTTLYVANMRPKEIEVCKPILNYAKNILISGTLKTENIFFASGLIKYFQDWKLETNVNE